MVKHSGGYNKQEILSSDKKGKKETLDLTVGKIFKQSGDAVVSDGITLRKERSELNPRSRRQYKQRGKDDADSLLRKLGIGPRDSSKFFRLDDDGFYNVVVEETVDIPDGHIGIIFPQESILHSGVRISSRFIGPNDEEVSFNLFLDDKVVILSEEAKVAELIVIEQ